MWSKLVPVIAYFGLLCNGFILKARPKNGLLQTALFASVEVSPTGEQVKEYSFVQDDLRTYAMKLHTRDQAPKEGQMKAETPFTKWEPSRADFLQFLVDSLKVWETFEQIIEDTPDLAPFRKSGLERSQALKEDISWMCTYDPSLSVPLCGEAGTFYSVFLKDLVVESMPKFICHYYNHYFAHTAGGRMIGKRMSDQLIEGKSLKFYEWEGDVKVLLDGVRKKIDVIAAQWTPDEKQLCLEETLSCFHYGAALVGYLKAPGGTFKKK